MTPVPDLDAPSVIFGDVSFLPKWDNLPSDYRDGWHQRYRGCAVAEALFYEGGSLAKLNRVPRDGVDLLKATAAISAALRSWEPKHEHKIAAVGWLIDEWFEEAR